MAATGTNVWTTSAIDYWKAQAGVLRGERDKLAAMLRRLEWAGRDPEQWAIHECPVCGGANPEHAPGWGSGHKESCDLAALLRDLP